MRLALPFAVLGTCIMLSGCGILDELFRKDPLTKEQRTFVEQALKECPGAKKINGTMLFNLAPVIEGRELGGLASKIAPPNLGDAAVVTHLWQNRICVLTKLDPTLGDRQTDWREEVAKAARNWPVFDAANYHNQVAGLKKAHTEHLAHIKEKYKNPGITGRISFEIFDAAIPFLDFMHVKDIGIGVVAGKDLKLKHTELGDSAASVCLSKYQYSTAVRPALDQTRSAAMGVARGTMTDAQAVEMMVSTVYEVGSYRLHEAKAGSDKAAQPVSCAPAVPKNPERKSPDDKKIDKTVDEKKGDGNKPDDKKTEEKKPLDEKKSDETKAGEKTGQATTVDSTTFFLGQINLAELALKHDGT